MGMSRLPTSEFFTHHDVLLGSLPFLSVRTEAVSLSTKKLKSVIPATPCLIGGVGNPFERTIPDKPE